MQAEAGTPRIGLFGGSFDPPHCGHEALVLRALQALHLDGLWVVPAGQPVHRRLSGHAGPEQRLAWMQRIFAEHEQVEVLDWEVMRRQPTPSIDTLRRFHREFPDMWPVLLLGEDAFAAMDAWVDYPEHAALCDVAVFSRAGYSGGEQVMFAPSAFRPMQPEAWLTSPARCGQRVHVEADLPDVSATDIRRRARNEKSLAGLVPECIRREIEQAYAAKAG
ncbi:MAG: nicotinate (nicotinamide) nucleotide adenylyltransferase [Mariprofundaceae bacterium]|nr:nicotinate (nicotinamide) nucleotide adenylyltransferase [Mariprofundaceae bacterium]